MTRAQVTAVSLLSLLSLTSPLLACTQPKVQCTSAHGTYVAAYKLKKGDPMSPCGGKQIEVLGMQSYFAGGGPDNKQKYNEGSVAIRPEDLGLLLEYAQSRVEEITPEPEPNSVGKFTSGKAIEDDFCEIPTFSESHVVLPDIQEIPDDPATPDDDETMPAQAATDLSYVFSNARFLVTADAQGTQFTADLKFTQDGCTAEYEVTGVYPVIGCVEDRDCLCLAPAEDATPAEKKMYTTECIPSGMNPDFAVKCNTDYGLCVLAEAPPSYQ